MILRIQHEESLRSFLERNILINSNSPDIKSFAKISNKLLDLDRVKIIANSIGWFGFDELNKLLHHHSSYALKWVAKSKSEIADSTHTFIKSGMDLEKRWEAFCPKCVKEDLELLGFSYWRRTHSEDVKVCVKHNVCLVDKCPFCMKPFSLKEHALNAMWVGCSGRNFSDCESIMNSNESELRRARFYKDACEYKYFVPSESAIKVMEEKLLSVWTVGDCEGLSLFELLRREHTRMHVLVSAFGFIGAAQEIYDDFAEFIGDVEKLAGTPVAIVKQ